jgi:hypothetical protein
MSTGIIFLGVVGVVAMAMVSIVAMVFGRGFRGSVNADGITMETDDPQRGAK